MNKTKIEYVDLTFNPVTGCLHPCRETYCYAAKIARRFGGCYDPVSGENIKQDERGIVSIEHTSRVFYKTKKGDIIPAPYSYGFAPTFHRYRLGEPGKLKKPSTIFVCSMSDLFGEWIPDAWIQEVFAVCAAAPWHR
jgi:protein gp37